MEEVRNETLKISPALKRALGTIDSSYTMAVISGASSGIGAAIAQVLLEGAPRVKLVNLSRSPSNIDPSRLVNIPCDVSDENQLEGACAKIFEMLSKLGGGRILLVNNAGFGGYGFFPEPDPDRNMNMIDVNVRALTWLCAKFLPEIKKRGGGIINVASTAAFQPCPYLGVYGATKAYVLNFSLALDWELRKFKATCLCLCPGPTSTNFFKAAGFEKRPLKSSFGHTAPQVAEAALRAYAAGKNLETPGFLNKLLGFANHLVPRSVMPWIAGAILAKFRN